MKTHGEHNNELINSNWESYMGKFMYLNGNMHNAIGNIWGWKKKVPIQNTT